jgi:hypothetical protein
MSNFRDVDRRTAFVLPPSFLPPSVDEWLSEKMATPPSVFSSRRLERATYDSVAFRYIAANDHPDHVTIASVNATSTCGVGQNHLYIHSLANQHS